MTSIIYKKGNLLGGPEKIIAHGCNALGIMGAGVAKQIKQTYPKAFEVYHQKHGKDGLTLGEVVPWVSAERIVLNMITQQAFGNTPGVVYVDYEQGIRKCMRALENAARRHQQAEAGPFYENSVVAMPKIGAGLAGGDWGVIASIIEAEVNALSVVVYEM